MQNSGGFPAEILKAISANLELGPNAKAIYDMPSTRPAIFITINDHTIIAILAYSDYLQITSTDSRTRLKPVSHIYSSPDLMEQLQKAINFAIEAYEGARL